MTVAVIGFSGKLRRSLGSGRNMEHRVGTLSPVMYNVNSDKTTETPHTVVFYVIIISISLIAAQYVSSHYPRVYNNEC